MLSDGNVDRRSWNEKLGKSEFTLAFILLLGGHSSPSFRHLPDPSSLSSSVQEFASWIICGRTGAEPSVFFSHSVGLALVLLRHGQYDAVEVGCCHFHFILPKIILKILLKQFVLSFSMYSVWWIRIHARRRSSKVFRAMVGSGPLCCIFLVVALLHKANVACMEQWKKEKFLKQFGVFFGMCRL